MGMSHISFSFTKPAINKYLAPLLNGSNRHFVDIVILIKVFWSGGIVDSEINSRAVLRTFLIV